MDIAIAGYSYYEVGASRRVSYIELIAFVKH